MIRHFNGTDDCATKISAQARQGRIVVLVWTWKKHRVVRTQVEGQRVMRVWRRWYERQGWSVSTAHGALRAVSPDGEVHGCGLHIYDAETRQRIYFTPPRPKKTETVKPRRRGRKPVGV